MSKASTFTVAGGLRLRPKPLCEHTSEHQKFWSGLEGRMVRPCRCVAAPSFPGCIEDWRVAKVACPHYRKPA